MIKVPGSHAFGETFFLDYSRQKINLPCMACMALWVSSHNYIDLQITDLMYESYLIFEIRSVSE